MCGSDGDGVEAGHLPPNPVLKSPSFLKAAGDNLNPALGQDAM